MKDRLDKFIRESGLKHWSFAARKDNEFYGWVMQVTDHLPEDMSFAARVWAAVHDDGPVCTNGKMRTLKSIEKGWQFCGPGKQCLCASNARSVKSKAMWEGKTGDQVQQIVENRRQTLLSKYGVDNPGKLESAKAAHQAFYADEEKVIQATEAGRQTMLAKYGVDNALKLPTMDRKAISQRHLSAEAKAILNDSEAFSSFVSGKSVAAVTQALGINATTFYNYMRTYDIEVEFGSSFEREITAFLRENNISFRPRDRTAIAPLEIDFLIQSHNLAIEFNGLYFHSSHVVSDDFHRRKWAACEAAGLRLLMINEDEYVVRPDVVRRKILNLCGKSERGPGARKLRVERIAGAVAMAFCETNHLQGSPGKSITQAYGAFLGDDLVGVVTLSRQRGTKQLELSRFCSDGRVFPGMFSKIMRVVSEDVSEDIVTFADLRYSDGGLYISAGFDFVNEIRPDYKYVKRNQTFHKSLFTKKRIAARFGIDMTDLTERTAMEQQGYSRIYDCGKRKYVWSKK